MSNVEVDFSDSSGDDFEALARDRVPVRSMTEADLPAIIATDRKITGRDRTDYYKGKLTEALQESGVRVSLVAEIDGQFAGFLMARVDYGEYGHTASAAIIDTIGVSPAYAKRNVGKALLSQLMANLASLRVEKVRTRVAWNDYDLLAYLEHSGFKPSQRLCFSRHVA